jgi:hypothetical protein
MRMSPLTIWLKLMKDSDLTKGATSAADLDLMTQAIPISVRVLKGYLDQIFRAAGLALHLAQVKADPTMEQVGGADALVYVTPKSLSRSFADRNNLPLRESSAPGRTVDFPQGALSEIFIQTIRSQGGDALHCGNVLANLAIHEIAHNKCIGDPNVLDQDAFVHQNGGGALFGKPIMPALLRSSGSLSPDNIKFIAPRIARSVPQFRFFLPSTRLGF